MFDLDQPEKIYCAVVVTHGRKCPEEMLPVYSVGDAEEAKDLLVLACSTNYKGEYIAKELREYQTIYHLGLFGKRLKSIHDKFLVPRRNCRCKGDE